MSGADPIEMTAGADTLAWDIFRADNASIDPDLLRADFPTEADYAIHIAEHLRELGYAKPPKNVKGDSPLGRIRELFKQLDYWERDGHTTAGIDYLRRHFKDTK
jgi:hypothetical protein